MTEETLDWIEDDKDHSWHPFTDQEVWTAEEHEPLVLVRGEGVYLWDSEGKRYLDGNSSIWTNIHGHNHPKLNEALTTQLTQVAHTSYLGFANPRASELAERLCRYFPAETLERVFFSDDGSTAVEVALKMAVQYRLQTGEPERTGFVAFANGYHGDTLGAASLGDVSRFFERFQKFGFSVTWVSSVEELRALPEAVKKTTAAVVLEPLVQGVNQMHVWPEGMLVEVRDWCDQSEVHLILDEVMTGFGRTGAMFACQHEEVVPDFLCLAKGLTGGYLPLAATLTTDKVYQAFNGAENVFSYGHSYTANQLACAVALANLNIFSEDATLLHVAEVAELFQQTMEGLAGPQVKEVRVCGMIAGVELVAGDARGARGREVCAAARELGLLTRPILDTVVIMPPLCITAEEIREVGRTLGEAMSS
jgi:adenosylmethionine-8-amino-7-oxononanoate aminotransferase